MGDSRSAGLHTYVHLADGDWEASCSLFGFDVL